LVQGSYHGTRRGYGVYVALSASTHQVVVRAMDALDEEDGTPASSVASAALACDSSARGGRVPSDVAAFNPGVAMGVTCSCSVLKVLGATLLSHALPDMAISPEDGARV
jgi:hypothetical protein